MKEFNKIVSSCYLIHSKCVYRQIFLKDRFLKEALKRSKWKNGSEYLKTKMSLDDLKKAE